MGYYIECQRPTGKVDQILAMIPRAVEVPFLLADKNFRDLRHPTINPDAKFIGDNNYAVIVIIDNGSFEAAGYCYDRNEFDTFTDPTDMRPRRYVLMPHEDAKRLTGYADRE